MKKILILTLVLLAIAKMYCQTEAELLAQIGITEMELSNAEKSYAKWGEHVKTLRAHKDDLTKKALQACRR